MRAVVGRVGCSLLLVWACLIAPLMASAQAQERIVLFIVPQGDLKKPRKNDLSLLLRDMVRENLRDSDRFDVVTFDPSQAHIKRAVLERSLDTSDIVPPLTPESMQKVCRVLGASRFLSATPTEDPKGMKAEVLFMEAMGPQAWQTRLSETISTGEVIGTTTLQAGEAKVKVRLARNDAAVMLADMITVRVGIPSQLKEKLIPLKNALPKAKNEKPKPQPKETTPDPKLPDGGQETTLPVEPPKNTNNPPANVKPPKGNTPKPEQKPNPRPKDNTPPLNVGTPNGAGADIIANTEELPLNVQRVDSEEQLRRYRQEGDLANVIVAIRKAINEKPLDMQLRQQLVQAYQDKGMLETAQAEAERALILHPKDPLLLRLMGSTLLARGEVTKALAAFREAMSLDPKDIRAQIALGDALLADNQFKEAFETYETAAKNAPESPLPNRRLARALLSRAASDLKSYEESLAQIQKARMKTPSTDTDSYLEDYIAIMRLMESRMKDMLGELQNGYQGYKQGKIKPNDLNRALGDLKERSKAAEDYLEKLPSALAQESTHARYQQGSIFVTQAISLFRAWLQDNDMTTETGLRTAQANANREINAASAKLAIAKDRPTASGGEPNSN